MPINPLDLQTNFSQMNKVGRQVSHEHETDAIKQEVAGMHIQKESKKISDEVPQINKNDKDYAKIKDKKNQQDKNKNDKNENEDENNEELIEDESQEQIKNKKNPYLEPNLGHKIDILS